MDERTEELLLKEEKNRLRKERQKRRKYRLLLLLLLMGGTGVMLTTSTYAWFTANRNVAIQDLQVNVSTSNGIQISADATNWKSIVQTADLTGAIYSGSIPNANQLPNALAPVSTMGATNDKGQLEMYLGKLETSKSHDNNGSYILTATKEPEEAKGEAGNFIAFDLFFKVTESTPLYLNTGSGVKDGNDIAGIKNASRIAFIIEGNHAAGTALGTIQDSKIGASTTKPEKTQVYFWEPNFDVHTAAGVAHAKDVYQVTTSTTGGKALKYAGIKAPITTDKDILRNQATEEAKGDYFATVSPDLTSEAEFAAKKPIFTLAQGITKVRVYVWVEGQDVDCEDTASGGDVLFTLSISADAS